MSSTTIKYLALAASVAVLAACSGEQSSAPTGQQAAEEPAGAADSAPAAQAPEMAASEPEAPAEPVSAGEMVDHGADVMEFEIKKALAGVESLIEDYTEEGIDTAELEEKKDELMAELEQLQNGN